MLCALQFTVKQLEWEVFFCFICSQGLPCKLQGAFIQICPCIISKGRLAFIVTLDVLPVIDNKVSVYIPEKTRINKVAEFTAGAIGVERITLV